MWWVPAVIFVACFTPGAAAAAHWLPDVEAGRIGGLAFFVACGLFGAGLGLLGLHIYSVVEYLEISRGRDGGYFLAHGLQEVLFEPGIVFGLSAIVFLRAPRQAEPSVETQPSANPRFH